MAVLHDGPGQGRWITVVEDQGLRTLLLDGWEEGAMALASDEPVFHYLWFHRCSRLALPPVRRALVLGAGAFTAAKCLALDHPQAAVDVVDIEPELGPIARQHFRLDRPEFRRVHFHGVPAEAFLAGAPGPYDFVFDDLFDGCQHVPDTARTPAHVGRLHAALAPGGACVKNLIWDHRSADTQAACAQTVEAWRTTFPGHAAVALGNPARGHNLLLIGTNRPLAAGAPVRTRLAAAGLPEAVLADCTLQWSDG